MLKFLILLGALALTPEHVDINLIRYGNYSQFDAKRNDKVATVDSKLVYAAIPEYQTIKRENLKKGSARHARLIRACTSKFKASLKASKGSYVLIVEIGGVSNYPSTDITKNIIKNLN